MQVLGDHRGDVGPLSPVFTCIREGIRPRGLPVDPETIVDLVEKIVVKKGGRVDLRKQAPCDKGTNGPTSPHAPSFC